ncbi:type III-A CRISPR-associated RAMP protein Csm3 [Desulfobacterales bacterium HSG2]|nr:type III-A CRISPR-associated RAMP protein Csm3 [Desulfobacterales bacterium HSG2]
MKLERVRTIKGQIRVITGLHIGASNENIEIGGLDNPIIKDPLPGSNAPYIPGSSLKGKFRSLIEIKEGRFVKDGRLKGNPCDCGKRECPVCAVFGTSAANRPENLGPTRIVVRDAHLSKKRVEDATISWKERFEKGDLPMEVKYENAINRITGVANPRPLERVPAGVEFDFNIAFKVFENDPESYFATLLKAMRLLEMDALGGAGSRGCGQIQFVNITIDGEQKPENFLESVELN